MKKILAFASVLGCGLGIWLASELMQLGNFADASDALTTAPASTAPPPPPSHSELRERYRKRMEEIAKGKAEEEAKNGPVVPSEKDLQELHTQLKDRTKLIENREAELQAKETQLGEKQAFLQQQLGKYEATLAKLRQELKALESSREEKVSAFRQVYEKMEPKKAARILDDLDSELASKILAGMKQQQAAEILAKMDPEKARRITKRFLSSTGQTSTQ